MRQDDREKMLYIASLISKEIDRQAMQPWRPMQIVTDASHEAAYETHRIIEEMMG